MEAPEVLEVRCAGCDETLEVELGLTEFACPGCYMQQALPPELMPPPRPRRALPLHSRGDVGRVARISCSGCGAGLSVPRDLRRLNCPVCATDLLVDGGRPRLQHVAPSSGVQVVSPAGVASLAPTFLRPPKEDPISQPIRVRKVQIERYNKPNKFAQTRGVFPACSVHRDESTNSARTNTKKAVYVVGAKDAPVRQSSCRDESHMMQARLSTIPGSSCAEKVLVEHSSKVSDTPQSQLPSNYLFHTNEVHGQHRSNDIGSHRNQESTHASISSIVEQETVMPPSQTASAEHVRVKSCGNKKRKKSSSTGGKHKRKHRALSSSNEELHHTLSKHSPTQPEGTMNTNSIQEQVPFPHENRLEFADIDRIIANLHPNSSSQKQMSQAQPDELDDIDGTFPPVSINHGTSEVDSVLQHSKYPAEATDARADRSINLAQEQEMTQLSSDEIDAHDKSGAQVWQNPLLGVMHRQQIQDDSQPEQVKVQCHNNKIVGHHKSKENDSRYFQNEGDSIENKSYVGTCQQVTVATVCCGPTTSPPLLTATPLPSTTSPSVLTRPSVGSVHEPSQNCKPPNTIHCQDVHAAGVGNIKCTKHRGRGPNKLIEPRREADRPVLTPNNVDTWDIHPPCPKVASTISALVKQYHPGSTYKPSSQQNDDVHQGELILHFQQYHSDTRTIIMDEFLKRYKWAPGREAECLKLFNRRIVRQFTGLLCDEKRRARVELAASRKVKGALDAHKSNRETNLDYQGSRKSSKQPRREPSAVGCENDDPLQWKPFPPEWMLPKWWDMLCDHWASEEILQVSAQKRKNRYTGGSARHTAGSRSITMHRQLMIIENGGKPVSDVEVFSKTHKRNGGMGEFVTEKARRTVEGFQRRLEAAGDTEPDPHIVWAEEIGGRNRGRYYGLHGVIDKARIGTLSKSIPGRKKHQQMFTQDQVQEMINQATQQLNETWENRFQSLEESMRSMASSSSDVPEHAPWSSAAGPKPADDQAPRQSASDSASEESYESSQDDGEATRV